jgi:hypothetical protein
LHKVLEALGAYGALHLHDRHNPINLKWKQIEQQIEVDWVDPPQRQETCIGK